MTIHPDVSGRPHVLLMHERIIVSPYLNCPRLQLELLSLYSQEHINKHEGVEWVTMAEMVDEFKLHNSVPEGALMPATPGSILQK